MILYGRNLSPFARRVAIWCALQGREIERSEITVMGKDFEELKRHNPVGRVPILTLDDGTELIETFAICDWLDETMPEKRLIPVAGIARRAVLQKIALANSVAEKGVAMVYERNRRPEGKHWMDWQQRLVGQIQNGLAAIEAALSGVTWPDTPDGGDVATVIAYQFVEVSNPWILEPGYPRLKDFAEAAMANPAIAATKPAM